MAFELDGGKRMRQQELIIPSGLAASEIASYLDDLYHEMSRPGDLTAVGVAGWLLIKRGHLMSGLVVLVVYAVGGLDSLGHYLLAPLSAHNAAMNSTILLEVTCAGLVLAEVMRQLVRRAL